MPSIGETLREARMRQRLDIADVEQRTKIRAKYLRALENEEFGMLPGPTFVKTFMRTYAELLGLDPYVLVEEYRATYQRDEDDLELQPLGPPSVAARERRRGPRVGPGSLALLVVVAVVALLVTIGLLSDDEGDGRGGEITQAQTETTRAEPREEPAPERPRRVRLRLVPNSPVYVCVDRGPGTDVIFESTIDAPQAWRGRRLRVLLGRRDLQLTANGERVELAPSPDPVAFAFTPRGSRELPDGEGPCA